MKLKNHLSTKVTLFVALALIPVFSVAAFLHLIEVKKLFIEKITWISQSIAEQLKTRVIALDGYPPEIQRMLGLNVDCQDILSKYKEQGIIHVGVISNTGMVIGHTDTVLCEKKHHTTQITSLMEKELSDSRSLSDQTGDAYHILIPVSVPNKVKPVAVIDIAFDRELLDGKVRKNIAYLLFTYLIFLAVSFLAVSFLLDRFVTRPISVLCKAAAGMADGTNPTIIDIHGTDEVGLLAESFTSMQNAIFEKIDCLNNEIRHREIVQHQLSESEEDMRITLNSIGDAVMSIGCDGKIKRITPAAEALIGYKHEDAIGRPLNEIFNIVNAKTRQAAFNPVNEVLKSGNITNMESDTILISQDGTEHRISDSAAPIKDSEGNTTGVVLVFRDITREYQLEEQLRQSEKMQAIGQLAGGVAHDFNNMLSGIMNAAQLLNLPERNLDEKGNKLTTIILQAAQRAAELTAKLLAFARKGTVSSTTVNMHQVLDEALSIINSTIDKKITIELKKNATKHILLGDPTDLQNVFINLGINASHAMPDGGSISIVTGNTILSKEFCNASHFDIDPGEYIEIEFRDSGCGIPPENIKKVFEPFFTTKEQGKGTGLGLATVYGTVKAHHGAITIYSEVGKGTVFHIYMPCAPGDIVSLDTKTQVIAGTGCILLVDDEEIVRVTGKLILEDMGYNVLLAGNGKEAVKIFRERNKEISLVIMDMVMPEMNGSEAFYEMRKIDGNSKIIISSGFPREESMNELKKNGVYGFINKPYRNSELSEILANVLK